MGQSPTGTFSARLATQTYNDFSKAPSPWGIMTASAIRRFSRKGPIMASLARSCLNLGACFARSATFVRIGAAFPSKCTSILTPTFFRGCCLRSCRRGSEELSGTVGAIPHFPNVRASGGGLCLRVGWAPPASPLDIHITSGAGDCKDFVQGGKIDGYFIADDLHFGGWGLSTEPNSFTTPSNQPTVTGLAPTDPAPAPGGHAWHLDTGSPVAMEPCGTWFGSMFRIGQSCTAYRSPTIRTTSKSASACARHNPSTSIYISESGRRRSGARVFLVFWGGES